jgi:hypothetical protein
MKPILFTPENAQKVHLDTKWQTRRIIQPQPTGDDAENVEWVRQQGNDWWHCPYGNVGDTVWVREAWVEIPAERGEIVYRAPHDYKYPIRWKPAIHMPKWATRTTRVLKRVWVERLQDISAEDAIAEGCRDTRPADPLWENVALQEYRTLWNSINIKPNKKKDIYYSYPWEYKDFDNLYPDARERGEYRGLPLKVIENPYVWCLEFNRETPAR